MSPDLVRKIMIDNPLRDLRPPEGVGTGMIPKSGVRFSEKIMPETNKETTP